MREVGRGPAPGGCHRFALSPRRTGPARLLQLPARAVLLSPLVVRAARQRRLRALARFWRWQLVRRLGVRSVLIDLLPSVPFGTGMVTDQRDDHRYRIPRAGGDVFPGPARPAR